MIILEVVTYEWVAYVLILVIGGLLGMFIRQGLKSLGNKFQGVENTVGDIRTDQIKINTTVTRTETEVKNLLGWTKDINRKQAEQENNIHENSKDIEFIKGKMNGRLKK